MTIAPTFSKTIAGAALSDPLTGGGAGIDFGQVIVGKYCPLVDQASNTGWAVVYVRHNAVVDPITDCQLFIEPYDQTYGGAAANPTADFNTLKSKGAASSTVANNDGSGGGLRVEMDADIPGTLGAAAFLASRPQSKIFGKASLGIDLPSAYPIHVDAMVLNSAGNPVDAIAPETGKIGKTGDANLGDRASLKFRYYLESNALNGGVIQGKLSMGFAYSA